MGLLRDRNLFSLRSIATDKALVKERVAEESVTYQRDCMHEDCVCRVS